MKLNYKRTILVGMAFFVITAFWSAYDAIIPLILLNHYGLPHTISGAVMSIDNVLAVFLLPFFGALSDKVHTKHGKRTPFIVIGTIVSIISFVALSFIDNYQLARVVGAGIPELAGTMGEEELAKLTLELTLKNPLPLAGFMATLLIVLFAMSIFRSPAVALMPDVTVKPLRSKGNAIINLTGTASGIIVLGLGMVFATSKNLYMQYTGYFLSVAAVMLFGLVLFMATVKENKWAKEMEEESARLGIDTDEPQTTDGKRKLTREERRSLLLILASVALWYVGYNSITSKYSTYASTILEFDFNFTMIIAQIAAIIS